MLHFTCDGCGKPVDEERFVARIEVYPAFDPDQLTEADLDADHLAEMSQLLEDMDLSDADADSVDAESEDGSRQLRLDLCHSCRKRFLADPLGREGQRRLRFSEN